MSPLSSSEQGVVGFVVVAPDGTEIATSKNQDADLGSSALIGLDPTTIHSALGGKTALGLPLQIKTSPRIVVAAPVLAPDGRPIAALALLLDPASDFTRFVQIGRLGKTGETYAFDRSGRLLTESRFDTQLRNAGLIGKNERGILNIRLLDPGVNLLTGARPSQPRDQLPLTRMAKDAVSGHSGMDLDGYRDYRGVPVVGAWLWDDELGIGLTTEQDVEEVFYPIRRTYLLLLTMIGSLLVSGLVIVGLLSSRARFLERAVVAREQLLTVVSHDLRNPLESILLNVAAMKKRRPGDLDSLKFLNVTQDAARRMERLMSDLLNAARLETGKLDLELQRCSPQELLETAIELNALAAGRKSLKLEMSVDNGASDVYADSDRITRVISNLLENAIKFSPEGRSIELKARPNQEMVCFSVSDQGPGIPKEDRDWVFERYWRGRDGLHRGTGLGLFIAKGFVEAHGGKMWLESEEGKGSAFYFRLPVPPRAH
jgi:signal transduction histidine kinase